MRKFILAHALAIVAALAVIANGATETGSFTNPLAVGSGGTGLGATPANGQLLIGNATNFTLATITGTSGFIGVSNGSGSITLGSSAADANGLSTQQCIQRSYSLASNGADLTIYSSNAPFAFTILDCYTMVTTSRAASSGTLRSATAGGGTALSDSLLTSATGYQRNVTFAGVSGAFPTVALNGTLVWRISGGANGSAVVGNLVVVIQR